MIRQPTSRSCSSIGSLAFLFLLGCGELLVGISQEDKPQDGDRILRGFVFRVRPQFVCLIPKTFLAWLLFPTAISLLLRDGKITLSLLTEAKTRLLCRHHPVKECDLGLRSLHTLRHTFASWLALQGTPILTIKELMGHKRIEMTMRYSHLIPDVKKQAVQNHQKFFEDYTASRATREILPSVVTLDGISAQPEAQPGLNGHIRIQGLSAPVSSLCRDPGDHGLLAYPVGDIASILASTDKSHTVQ